MADDDMRYWITTHWPRKRDESTNQPQNGIWVKDENRTVIDRVAPGDLVFLYETKSGPDVLRNNADGSKRRISRHPGAEGIVVLAEVTERAYEPENSSAEEYADGTELWWRYYAPTRSVNSAGSISRVELNSVLGYSTNNVLHGFGEQNSGLKEISEDVYEQLRTRFLLSSEKNEKELVARAPGHRFGPGGEGPEHLALKERIADDPAAVLGEPGLQFWKKEWPFPTGDKIDLVLKDRLGRLVAVEVEVCCSASELAGPLQCMKYRAMLSYFFKRPLEEIRCILVAHTIHAAVCERCGNHEIEVKTVAKL